MPQNFVMYLVGMLWSSSVRTPKAIEKTMILRLRRRAALRVELRISAVGIHRLKQHRIKA
jgi:hypothetical protein